jgi:hypothetical protein
MIFVGFIKIGDFPDGLPCASTYFLWAIEFIFREFMFLFIYDASWGQKLLLLQVFHNFGRCGAGGYTPLNPMSLYIFSLAPRFLFKQQ